MKKNKIDDCRYSVYLWFIEQGFSSKFSYSQAVESVKYDAN